MQQDVIALVVTYHPDLEILGRLIDKCAPQVKSIVLVDNDDGVQLKEWLAQRDNANVTLLSLGENCGIATAQNAGINWARAQGAKQVLVFDHDSDPPIDLVARLQSAFTDLQNKGLKVAAVGPRHIDGRRKETDNPSPFIRLAQGRILRVKESPYVSVDCLISSGSLILMKALDEIGQMQDNLFIDYVDTEWCLRARRMGWSIYGVWDAIMDHRLGDDHVRVLGRQFTVHGSLRHYYLIRNATWLCLHADLSGAWKFILAYNALAKFVLYSLIMPKPWIHFRMMCLGLWHSVIGRMGKL